MGARAWLQQRDSACHVGCTKPPALSWELESSALGLASTPRQAGTCGVGTEVGTLRESCICPTATVTALFGAEYGVKLGSQLFIKHIVESGLAAKGNSLQEGDLILKVGGAWGARHSLGVSSAPLWRAHPWLVSLQDAATVVLGAVLSVPTSYPSPPGCPRDPAGPLRAQLPAARVDGMSYCHSGVMSILLSLQCVVLYCVSMFPLDDCHRCLSDKTML